MPSALELRKRDIIDPAQRVRDLVSKMEPKAQRGFLEAIIAVKSQLTLNRLADLLAGGRVEEALELVEWIGTAVAAQSVNAFVISAQATSTFMAEEAGINIAFDQYNPRAMKWAQEYRFNLIREFRDTQREAVREALYEGIRTGVNPRDQARLFRGAIGLTQRQVQAVGNYRRLLLEGSSEALSRKLRDHRFDSTVRAAIRGDRPLSIEQINRMVDRYRERYIKYRSETIARTEALRSVHSGNQQMYSQAFEEGELSEELTYREWNTSPDERRRASHAAMHGQERGVLEAFRSGNGNDLMYPGDPSAPGDDTIQCRCSVGTRIRLPELQLA